MLRLQPVPAAGARLSQPQRVACNGRVKQSDSADRSVIAAAGFQPRSARGLKACKVIAQCWSESASAGLGKMPSNRSPACRAGTSSIRIDPFGVNSLSSPNEERAGVRSRDYRLPLASVFYVISAVK